MNLMLEQADPALGVETDSERLRALVDERIGLEPSIRPVARRIARPWVVAIASFVVVLLFAIPALLNNARPAPTLPIEAITDLPGVSAAIPLASGGVQTMAIDGNDIWVVTALQNVLQRVSRSSNQIEDTFPIDGYVEGVVSGGGYLWLFSYDNGGEVLRFDPVAGMVDLSVPLGGLPGLAARWYDGRLFASNDQGEYLEISAEGEILSRNPGSVRGDGLGLLWVFDPGDGSIRSLAADGTLGEYVIPGSSPEFGDLGEVRGVDEAGGYLWLRFGDSGESVGRFDPTTGQLQPLHVGRWLHSSTQHDGALWMTSYSDDLLFRVDPESGEVRTFALPGRPGGVESVDGDLWILLYQPGSLLRIDPSADLIEMGPEVASITFGASGPDTDTLVCTLGGVDTETLQRAQVDHDFTGLRPTVVLEGPSWIGIGIWSVVQAQVEGRVVCASGHQDEGGTPQQRAAGLSQALEMAGIPGPYQLVAAGDGVHTVRLFAQGRDDIAGAVLVEPIPVGFQEFYDSLLGEEFAHPGWIDIDPTMSESATDFGGLPLVILSHDPNAVFLSDVFVDAAGEQRAQAVSDYWEAGMDFYAALSTDSRRIPVPDTGFEGVLWFRPEMVTDAIATTANADG